MQIYIDKYIMQLNIEYLTSLHAEIEQKQQSMCIIHFITIVSNGPKTCKTNSTTIHQKTSHSREKNLQPVVNPAIVSSKTGIKHLVPEVEAVHDVHLG